MAAARPRLRLAPWAGGVVLAVFALVLEEGGALIEPNNECLDQVVTTDLFAAGAFHTCGAIGMTVQTGIGQTAADYARKLTCWGWEDFGQLDPPAIDHVTSLTAGARHSCATDRQRTPVCWGSNLYGQLDLPRPLGVAQTYCRQGDYISDPSSRVKFMCEDKGLVDYNLEEPISKTECIVPNATGDRMGILEGFTRWNTTTDFREKPVFRFDNKFVCSVKRMSAGGHHTCIIYGDDQCTNCNTGYMECFGWNDYNQSSPPQCFDASKPRRVSMQGDKDILQCDNNRSPLLWKDVSAGLFHTCAISTWGELICWGDNRSGQLANMVAGEYTYPTQIKFQKVCAGAYHSCTIMESFPNTGQVDCWGNNEYGQALDWADLLEMELVEKDGQFIHISCGASHTCGTYLPPGNTEMGKQGAGANTGQRVICWGANFAGQSEVPEDLANGQGNKHIVGISVGWEHSCVAHLEV
jgi:hypothetical protein